MDARVQQSPRRTPATPPGWAANCRPRRCWPRTSGSPRGPGQLKAAGLEGDMDVLRARAYLDLLLGKDSRPGQDTAGGQDGGGPG